MRHEGPTRVICDKCHVEALEYPDGPPLTRLGWESTSNGGDLCEACKPGGLRERLDRLERIVSGLRGHMVGAARADFDDRGDPRGRVADWVDAFLGSYLGEDNGE